MPPPHRLVPVVVTSLLERWFPTDRTILPSPQLSLTIVERCCRGGVDGGAVYDALVGLTATEAGRLLLTRDVRAARIYHRLGIDYELLP